MNITQNYFNEILSKNFLFEIHPKVAVAVSGGPDSMAIVFLLNKWIKKNKGSLIALIVDHQLRKNSNLEAQHIKKYLYQHKIKSQLLKVDKRNVVKKTMKEARVNRFNQLIKFCNKNNIFHLFVAHHFDDNLETFLLRKVGGSNFEGLNSIKDKVIRSNLQILRPLLFFNKEQIFNYNSKNNIEYINDPSNKNTNYTRTIVRNLLYSKLDYSKKIIEDFNIIKKYYSSYREMIFYFFHQTVLFTSKKNITVSLNKFLALDRELQIKIIELIYKFLMPKKRLIRYIKILQALTVLKLANVNKVNLGGMEVLQTSNSLLFTT